MANTVPMSADPVGTLPLSCEGLTLPKKYRDNEGGMVIRTRWGTEQITSYDGDRHVFPVGSPKRFYRDPSDEAGYVHNPEVGRGQVCLLVYGDEPQLFDLKLVGECECVRCGEEGSFWRGPVDEFKAHYAANHFPDEFSNPTASSVRPEQVIESMERAAGVDDA